MDSYIQGLPGGNVSILGGHSKQKSVCLRVLFWAISKIELLHHTVAKLLIKWYYILFLISVFVVQVTKLVQFTQYNTYSKIPPSTSLHCATLQLVWGCDMLLIWVHLDIPLCWWYHPLWDGAIRLMYLLLFCKLHSSSNPINKNLRVAVWREQRTILGTKSRLLYN